MVRASDESYAPGPGTAAPCSTPTGGSPVIFSNSVAPLGSRFGAVCPVHSLKEGPRSPFSLATWRGMRVLLLEILGWGWGIKVEDLMIWGDRD